MLGAAPPASGYAIAGIDLTGQMSVGYGGKLLERAAFRGRQGLLAFARLLLTREIALSREKFACNLWLQGLPRAWDAALNCIASTASSAISPPSEARHG